MKEPRIPSIGRYLSARSGRLLPAVAISIARGTSRAFGNRKYNTGLITVTVKRSRDRISSSS